MTFVLPLTNLTVRPPGGPTPCWMTEWPSCWTLVSTSATAMQSRGQSPPQMLPVMYLPCFTVPPLPQGSGKRGLVWLQWQCRHQSGGDCCQKEGQERNSALGRSGGESGCIRGSWPPWKIWVARRQRTRLVAKTSFLPSLRNLMPLGKVTTLTWYCPPPVFAEFVPSTQGRTDEMSIFFSPQWCPDL